MAFKKLFEPVKIGNVTVPNRIAMAPMGMGDPLYNNEETWPKKVIRYYEERAIGGVGLLITGFVRVHPKLASYSIVGLYDDSQIPSHRELVNAVHRHGSKIFHQIALMGGRFADEGPSDIYSNNYYAKPKALTTEELDMLIGYFIDAAGRGKQAGYDGVEVHGGHTYLIGAMMSPETNRRTDKYGGSFENRMRFVTEIINGIREKYPDYNIGVKFSAYEELENGIDVELGIKIAKYLDGLGVDYIHVSATSSEIGFASNYPSVPPMYIPRNTLIPLADNIKKECKNSLVLATGSITVPQEADEFIDAGKCDMVVLGRTILADAHWANKAKNNKREDIVPCIRCNVCYDHLFKSKIIACSLNPYLLHESEQDIPPAVKRKKVLVIGAGPAGIQCALTASKRGHEVLLYEKMPYIGGMMYPGSRPQFKADVARALDYFDYKLRNSNVKLFLDAEVTSELIDEINPDSLVVAMGAKPILPEIPGIDSPHVTSAIDVMRDIKKYKGSKAVVLGGGEVGCEAACYLADNGFKVTIVEIQPKILIEDTNMVMKAHLLDLVEKKGIEIFTETCATRIIPEGIEVLKPDGRLWGLDADLIAVAINQSPDEEKIKELCLKAPEFYVIGDCNQVARIKEAITDGEKTGRWI